MMARKMKDTDSEDEIRVRPVPYPLLSMLKYLVRKHSKSLIEITMDLSRQLNCDMS